MSWHSQSFGNKSRKRKSKEETAWGKTWKSYAEYRKLVLKFPDPSIPPGEEK